jgi:hypothetical protein
VGWLALGFEVGVWFGEFQIGSWNRFLVLRYGVEMIGISVALTTGNQAALPPNGDTLAHKHYP